ncbi:MAG: hypothetical protein ACRDWW_01115 [Acidimicrobiales bacterium]
MIIVGAAGRSRITRHIPATGGVVTRPTDPEPKSARAASHAVAVVAGGALLRRRGERPNFDSFEAGGTWDHATARVIDERMAVRPGGRLRFLAPDEAATLRAFCDTCTAQDCDPRAPVAGLVDEKLASGRLVHALLLESAARLCRPWEAG